MSDMKVFSIPDNGNGNSGLGNGVLPFMLGAGMSGGGFGGFGGFGGWNNITELFAMGILAQMFGWNNGGYGGFGGGGGFRGGGSGGGVR